ncbi:MAG: alpha-L-rhamnosidase N-terminal domain-containing protein [Planctomycetota bacterium]
MPEWHPIATDAWRALWIRAGGAGARAVIATRTEFECAAPPPGTAGEGGAPPARVFVASAGRYRLHVNGALAGEGPQNSVPPRLRYDCHDVGALVAEGANCVALIAAPPPGDAGPASVLVKAEVQGGGFPLVVGTDSQWRAMEAGWIAPSPEGGETHDPAGEPEGWMSPGFNDSHWPRADVAGGDPPGAYTTLAPRSVPPPAVEETFPVGCLREAANLGKLKGLKPFLKAQARKTKGKRRAKPPALVLDASKPFSMPEVVFDFGRLVRGRPVLELETKEAGGEVIVSYGETPDLARLDRVGLPAGPTRWTPLDLRSFRYLGVAVRGAAKPVSCRRASVEAFVRAAGPAGPSKAAFTCSDSKLGAAFRVARATLTLATADGLDERPDRAGPAVTGAGLRATALAAYYMGTGMCTDMRAVRGAFADLGARELPGAGASGRAGRGAPSPIDVADALFWAIALGEHVDRTSDSALAAELFDRLGACLATLERSSDRTGVFHGRSDVAGDRARAPFAAGGSGPAFLMCGAYRAGAGVARGLGRSLEADRWANASGTLGRVLRARFLRDDTGLYADTATRSLPARAATNAAALLWGEVGAVERVRLAEALASGACEPAETPLEAAIVAEALFEASEPEPALDRLGTSFCGMAKRGATEFWETFDPASSPAGVPTTERPYEGPSLAYGPGAVAGALVLRYVLGIHPPGRGAEILLLPGRAPLDRASGAAAFPAGEVRLQWKADRGRLEAKGRLPEGTAATLSIPLARGASGAPERFELVWGKTVFVDAGGRAVLPEGVERWNRSEGEVRLSLAEGASFDVTRRPPRR